MNTLAFLLTVLMFGLPAIGLVFAAAELLLYLWLVRGWKAGVSGALGILALLAS